MLLTPESSNMFCDLSAMNCQIGFVVSIVIGAMTILNYLPIKDLKEAAALRSATKIQKSL